MACGKNMAGVEADPKLFRKARCGEDAGKLLKGCTQTGALSGGCFKENRNGSVLTGFYDGPVKVADKSLQA